MKDKIKQTAHKQLPNKQDSNFPVIS